MVKNIITMRNYVIFIIAVLSIITYSCGSGKKKSPVDGDPKPPEISKIKPEEYYKKNIQYSTFSGKMNVTYKDAKQEQKIVVNVKMNKNKDFWANASALGGIVSVGRAYATLDSLKAIVNLNNTAYQMSYRDGVAMLKTDIEFASLQNLFIGNALLEGAPIKAAKEENNEIIINIHKDDYTLDITYDKTTAQIKKQIIENKKEQFKATILFNNYKPLPDRQPFSYDRNIEIWNKNEKILVTMEYTKAEINIPVSITFNIPANMKIQHVKP